MEFWSVNVPSGDNNRKLTDEQRTEAIRMYVTPNPDGTWTGVKTIARHFQVRPNTIENLLERASVKKRSLKEAYESGKRTKPITNLPPEGEPAPLCKCGCDQAVAWNQRKNKWNIYVAGHYRPVKPCHDEAWLREQYVEKRRSAEDIGRECGVAAQTILHYMKRFGIPRRSASEAHQGIQAGERNPAWKGGVTPERQRLYKTQEWKQLVRAIFQRDHYTCARCNRYRQKQYPKLHAHHLKPFAEYPELRFDPGNLITLCDDCHNWVHSKENVNREFLG